MKSGAALLVIGLLLGAALLAGAGAKVYSSVEESAREAIQVSECLYPRATNSAVYDRQYDVYRDLYPAVRDLAHRLSALSAESAPGH